MVITPQDRRRFVENLDFLTTPGWLQGGVTRVRAGLAPDTGPYRVITDMALMDFEPESKRMRVISIHPGFSFADVQEKCGFELLCAEKLLETMPPSASELQVLRREVDPYQYIIGR